MKYKPSNYNIFSDILNEDNERIVFNTFSTKKLIISEYLYKSLANNYLYEIPNSVINKLLELNLIVHKDKNEIDLLLDENISESNSDYSLYQAIQPSANCQLGCYYCGQKHEKNNLSNILSNKIIDRIIDKLNSNKSLKSLSIGWFGGEPLIAINELEYISEKLITYCSANNIDYSAKIATNGVSLNVENFNKLVKNKVDHIEITIDGTKEFHDSHRYYKNGKGSYERIIKNLIAIFNLKNFNSAQSKIFIRCNIDEKNFDNVEELINELVRNKFEKKIHMFYLAPIYSWGGNNAHENSLKKITYSKYEIKWLKQLLENGFPVKLIPNRKKVVCLSVDKNSEFIDTYGNIHNCTETSLSDIYKNEYIIDNIIDPSKRKEDTLSRWNFELKNETYSCYSCKFLPICGGACPKSWKENIAACPSIKFNMSERLHLLYNTKNKKND